MACFEAARLCPQGVLCRPHYEEYRRLSQEMFRILEEYTPTLVPTSIDGKRQPKYPGPVARKLT